MPWERTSSRCAVLFTARRKIAFTSEAGLRHCLSPDSVSKACTSYCPLRWYMRCLFRDIDFAFEHLACGRPIQSTQPKSSLMLKDRLASLSSNPSSEQPCRSKTSRDTSDFMAATALWWRSCRIPSRTLHSNPSTSTFIKRIGVIRLRLDVSDWLVSWMTLSMGCCRIWCVRLPARRRRSEKVPMCAPPALPGVSERSAAAETLPAAMGKTNTRWRMLGMTTAAIRSEVVRWKRERGFGSKTTQVAEVW
mmetsp:Transcript_90977/g.273272  ORF Transcript_90977/g.273272 Transcript_90977/m.273272 type:complete len:249 (+) Transcript_90977:118-864(+)